MFDQQLESKKTKQKGTRRNCRPSTAGWFPFLLPPGQLLFSRTKFKRILRPERRVAGRGNHPSPPAAPRVRHRGYVVLVLPSSINVSWHRLDTDVFVAHCLATIVSTAVFFAIERSRPSTSHRDQKKRNPLLGTLCHKRKLALRTKNGRCRQNKAIDANHWVFLP